MKRLKKYPRVYPITGKKENIMNRDRILVLFFLCCIAFALVFHGCESDQNTVVSVTPGNGSGDDGKVTRDTVYVDCPPCEPDTIYGNCPPCVPDTVYGSCPPCVPDTVYRDCPPCQTDSPCEGVFGITGLQSSAYTENCNYTFVTTTYQIVSVEEGMICFAGWMVDWDEASRTGGNEWTDYFEEEGIYYDTYVSFEIVFTGTDLLTVTLQYHVEAGYVGYAPSYACDDMFVMTAERATLSPGSKGLFKAAMPKTKIEMEK
jgi:hypothetical protein